MKPSIVDPINPSTEFVHLKVKSEFSVKSGLMSVKDIVNAAAENNMKAVGIADLNIFSSLIKFYKTSYAKDIKPIISLETLFIDDEGKMHEITLLAKNTEGYNNISRLMTRAYYFAHANISRKEIVSLQDQYPERFPKRGEDVYLTYRDLADYHDGVICLVSGYYGPIGNYARNDTVHRAEAVYKKLKEIYGNNLFQAISRCERPGEEKLEPFLFHYSAEYQMPLVATNDVYFKNPEDYDYHLVRCCIHASTTVHEYPLEFSKQQYFKSKEEMIALFKDFPTAIENTYLLAQLCSVDITIGKNFLPRFSLEKDKDKNAALIAEFEEFKKDHPELDEEEWALEKLAKLGLEERLEFLYPDAAERNKVRSTYDERLDFEINVIKNMKFPGYFLIVQEFINWSKSHNIPVGPGRGSGAGSLVAYALKITDLDPIKYDLLFERFLNPARKSMPDFDVDFCNEGRASVINHMQDRYGKDSVTQIMTFGTMGAKQVVRDVARALAIDRHKADRIAREIKDKIVIKEVIDGVEVEKEYKGTLTNNILYNPVVAGYYNSKDRDLDIIFEYSLKLEGKVRQLGKHAAGLVISPTDMNEYSALYMSADGESSTHYDKDDIEAAGLVKFDFLGLKTLTVLKNTVKMINEKHRRLGLPDFELDKISIEDPQAYDILKNGDTMAVFQLESTGITKTTVRSAPETFEDIISLIALYRPGPLKSGMVDNYINRKKGDEEVFYPDKELNFEALQAVLEPTYGVIVYQEQVMLIAQIIAGYTLGDADNLRRAMGKKKKEEMDKERSKFIDGAAKLGYDRAKAEALFELVDKFAGYGFNKSHSAAYALISYQTAYLKAHYRAEFIAANLTNIQTDQTRIYPLINNLTNPVTKETITCLKPSINTSKSHFYVNEKNEIVYSLAALKGVGEDVVDQMVKIREDLAWQREGTIEKHKETGEDLIFFDFYDFLNSCGKIFSEKQIRTMIHAGAFDCFFTKENGHSRELYDEQLATILKAIKSEFEAGNAFNLNAIVNNTNIDDFIKPKHIKNTKSWPMHKKLRLIYIAYGYYFEGHPILEYNPERRALASLASLKDLSNKFSVFSVEAVEELKKGKRPGSEKNSYYLLLHVENVYKTQGEKGTYLEIELSDETLIQKFRYTIYSARDIDEFKDTLETDSIALAKIQFNAFTSDNEYRVGTKLSDIRPLSEVLQDTPGELMVYADVSTERKGREFMQMIKDLRRENVVGNVAPNSAQTIRFGFLTQYGAVEMENSRLATRFSKGFISYLKYNYGINNLKFQFHLEERNNQNRYRNNNYGN